MVHIPTKLHQFLISSFRDFVRTDTQTDRRCQKQHLLAAWVHITTVKHCKLSHTANVMPSCLSSGKGTKVDHSASLTVMSDDLL